MRNSNITLRFLRHIRKPVLPATASLDLNTPSPKIDNRVKCRNCRKFFNPDENGECRFHSGSGSTGLRTHNGYDEIVYSCCGQVDKGFYPVHIESEGCVVKEKHEAYECKMVHL